MHHICIRDSHCIFGDKKSKYVRPGMCDFLNIWNPVGKNLSNAGMTEVESEVESWTVPACCQTVSLISHQRADGVFSQGLRCARGLQWAGLDCCFLQVQHLQSACTGRLGWMEEGGPGGSINTEPEKGELGGCTTRQGCAAQLCPSRWQEAHSYMMEHQVREQTQGSLYRQDYLKTAQGDCQH